MIYHDKATVRAMERYKRQIPKGVQDTLPLECYHKRRLEERVMRVFYEAGCDEIETPTLEYYDVFASGIGAVRQEKVQKFFDENGRILVLRPDITMPIARLAATRLYDGRPLRLCYRGNAFGTDDAFYAEQREFTQTGVELLGVKGTAADAELIAIAIEALRAAGITDYLIELGQVEFFKGLMEEAGIGAADADRLRAYVDEKNLLEVEMCLRSLDVDERVRERVLRLTNLYGGTEVFDEALTFSDHPRCRAAVANLKEVYDALCDFGLNENVCIDFGMLQSLDYYSGMVFKGVSERIGQPIISGGRYDHLVADFGKNIPATGFSMNVKRMLVALDRQGMLQDTLCIDVVVGAQTSLRAEAYHQAMALMRQGLRVILALHLDEEELQRYAQEQSARALYLKG